MDESGAFGQTKYDSEHLTARFHPLNTEEVSRFLLGLKKTQARALSGNWRYPVRKSRGCRTERRVNRSRLLIRIFVATITVFRTLAEFDSLII